MIKKWSRLISKVICNELNYDDGKRNIVAFGLEVILGGIIKIIIFLITAWALNILPVALGVVLTYISVRWVAGGAHLSSYFRCLLVSFTLIFATAYIAVFLSSFIGSGAERLILLISNFLIILYSPVENKQNPLGDKKQLYKIYSIAITIIITMLIIALKLAYDIRLSLALGLFLAAATITPIGNKGIVYIDSLFDKFNRKEV